MPSFGVDFFSMDFVEAFEAEGGMKLLGRTSVPEAERVLWVWSL